jgi:hypothetical protein
VNGARQGYHRTGNANRHGTHQMDIFRLDIFDMVNAIHAMQITLLSSTKSDIHKLRRLYAQRLNDPPPADWYQLIRGFD